MERHRLTQQTLLVLPIVVLTLVMVKYRHKLKKAARKLILSREMKTSLHCPVFQLSRRLEDVRRECLFALLVQLRLQQYCRVQLCAASDSPTHNFILISNASLVHSIQVNASRANSIFRSQLLQPYLIVDSRCVAKLTPYEYESVVAPLIAKHFEHRRAHFVDTTFRAESAEFIERANSTISVDSLFLFTFRIATLYLKSLYPKHGASNSEFTLIDEESCKYLHELHERFTLSIFTKDSERQVCDYTQLFERWLEILEAEFLTADMPTDAQIFRFLHVKSVYLDVLQIVACISWMLQDASNAARQDSTFSAMLSEIDKSGELREANLWKLVQTRKCLNKYYERTRVLDLYDIDEDVDFNPSEHPAEYALFYEEGISNRLIALNMYAMPDDICLGHFRPNAFIQTLSQCIMFSLLKTFTFTRDERRPSNKHNDLQLVSSSVASYRVRVRLV